MKKPMMGYLLNREPNRHCRFIFPVGQGGFAFEIMGDTTIIYDCGSLNVSLVQKYVNLLVHYRINHINYLFISHFDEDHVNGLTYLLSKIPNVQVAIMSRVPNQYRQAYNAATKGAYQRIIDLLTRRDIRIEEAQEYEPIRHTHSSGTNMPVWEWVGESMLGVNDWTTLDTKLRNNNVNIAQLNNPQYVNLNKRAINQSFIDAFGKQGPNSKGLMMLSHELVPAYAIFVPKLGNKVWHLHEFAGCLYTGDNYLKGQKVTRVRNFVAHHHVPQLLLAQVPHHGSNQSSSSTLRKLGADEYFVCDKSDVRYNKNKLSQHVRSVMVMNSIREMLITVSFI